MKKWQIENSEILETSEILFRVFFIPSFRFCPIAKIENLDLKISGKNFRVFQDFRAFDLATEQHNSVIIFQRAIMVGCNLRCIWLHIFQQKYPKIEFFIGYLLQMLKANDFDGCRTLIVQFPCQKMRIFLFASIISEKIASIETLKPRWGILYLLPCSGNS